MKCIKCKFLSHLYNHDFITISKMHFNNVHRYRILRVQNYHNLLELRILHGNSTPEYSTFVSESKTQINAARINNNFKDFSAYYTQSFPHRFCSRSTWTTNSRKPSYKVNLPPEKSIKKSWTIREVCTEREH